MSDPVRDDEASAPTIAPRSEAPEGGAAVVSGDDETVAGRAPAPDADTHRRARSSSSVPSFGRGHDGASRYHIDGEIGRGGMGAVYRAFDVDLQREVALKVLHQEIGADASFAARFMEEAQVAARLQHPGIVPVYDVGTNSDGKLYFTMKLVAGRTLADVIARARHGEEDAREFTSFRLLEAFREICRAISYVHERGIVHRDLKPHNVMLGSYGEVQLMDWGLAKVLHGSPAPRLAPKDPDDVPTLKNGPASPPRTTPARERLAGHVAREATVVGQVLGTPAYMAPEQARGDREVSPLWDVYALGGILHHILTGRPPLVASTYDELMKQLLDGNAPRARPRSIDPTIAREVEAICLRALAWRPEERYQTAKALADDVQAFVEQRPVSAFPEGRIPRARKWLRRRRRGVAAAAAATVLIVGGAVAVRGVTARAARSALVERAVARATDARTRFFHARDALRTAPHTSSSARAERDDLLGFGLDALQTAESVTALCPDEKRAQREAFDVAIVLGEVALEDEQWGLAKSAFDRAAELGVDEARAKGAIESVARARTRLADEHAHTVAGLIDDARSGRLAERAGGYEDALFTLVGLREPATVKTLAAELDAISAELGVLRREALLEADALSPEEQKRGEEAIPHLAEAVEKLVHVAPESRLDQETIETLRLAGERLRARQSLTVPPGVTQAKVHAMIGTQQERRLGAGRLLLARLASEALGRIGIADGAVESLERYLAVEEDELRAIPPGVALCLLGRPSAEAVLVNGRIRFTSNGLFWKEMSRFLWRLRSSSVDEPTTAAGYHERSKLRRARGDLDGAIADATREIELAPSDMRGFIERGIAHRRVGDLDSAIADYGRAIALDPTSATVWNDRGFAELEKGDLDAAISDLSHAISIHGKTPRARTHRATAYRLQGKLPLAIAEYTKAIATDERFVLAWRGRGDARLDSHDIKGALVDYEKALQLDGRDPATFTSIASARRAAGELLDAGSAVQKALELNPRFGLAWVESAELRAARGDTTGAIADLEKALSVELPPRDEKRLRARLASLRSLR